MIANVLHETKELNSLWRLSASASASLGAGLLILGVFLGPRGDHTLRLHSLQVGMDDLALLLRLEAQSELLLGLLVSLADLLDGVLSHGLVDLRPGEVSKSFLEGVEVHDSQSGCCGVRDLLIRGTTLTRRSLALDDLLFLLLVVRVRDGVEVLPGFLAFDAEPVADAVVWVELLLPADEWWSHSGAVDDAGPGLCVLLGPAGEQPGVVGPLGVVVVAVVEVEELGSLEELDGGRRPAPEHYAGALTAWVDLVGKFSIATSWTLGEWLPKTSCPPSRQGGSRCGSQKLESMGRCVLYQPLDDALRIQGEGLSHVGRIWRVRLSLRAQPVRASQVAGSAQ